jgi:hypothetical protein
MNLTYRSDSFFPFPVPMKDSSFASQVGAQTAYPAGFTLDQALQLYWRTQDYRVVANGSGTLDELTQTLAINQLTGARNFAVGPSSFGAFAGLAPACAGDLVIGRGLQRIIAGSGTVSATGPDIGTSPALFNLLVSLFCPVIFVPDPVVQYDGLWWPAMSISCLIINTVLLDGGGSLDFQFDCTTLADPSSTTNIGSFSFFGVSVPVFCQDLAPDETRLFSGALTVEDEWT